MFNIYKRLVKSGRWLKPLRSLNFLSMGPGFAVKHGAFTLAEVLITLTIIGVVASLTLPDIKQGVDAQANMAALQKTYSTLQQATNMAISEHENPIYWDMVDNSTPSINKVYSYYKPYFKMMRECPNSPGCWGYPTRYLSNTIYWSAHNTSWYQYAFTFTDGVSVLIDIYDAANVKGLFGINVNYDAAVFFVDVNSEKNPNVIGKDIFAFVVTERGMVPAGMNDTSNCKSNGTGFQCTAKIIQDGWRIKY